ncbi:MAG: VF530 family protein [Fuerstiella sp.]
MSERPEVTLSISAMTQSQPNNPLHGITLKKILEYLVAEYGWEKLSERIRINCFYENPSINSSLKFLRKTPWAREKVELLYVYSVSYDQRHGKTKANAAEPGDQASTGDQAPETN